MLWINALSYFTWMSGCVLGNIAFNFISFSLEGIDFIIVEFFCIVVISQIITDKSYISTSIGVISSILAFLVVGTNFILLAIIFSMILLLLLKIKLLRKKLINMNNNLYIFSYDICCYWNDYLQNVTLYYFCKWKITKISKVL